MRNVPAETADRTLSLISLLSSKKVLSSNLCFLRAISPTSSSATLRFASVEDPASG